MGRECDETEVGPGVVQCDIVRKHLRQIEGTCVSSVTARVNEATSTDNFHRGNLNARLYARRRRFVQVIL